MYTQLCDDEGSPEVGSKPIEEGEGGGKSKNSNWVDTLTSLGIPVGSATTYQQLFIQNDLDDPTEALNITIDDALLTSIGISNYGHKAKLIAWATRTKRNDESHYSSAPPNWHATTPGQQRTNLGLVGTLDLTATESFLSHAGIPTPRSNTSTAPRTQRSFNPHVEDLYKKEHEFRKMRRDVTLLSSNFLTVSDYLLPFTSPKSSLNCRALHAAELPSINDGSLDPSTLEQHSSPILTVDQDDPETYELHWIDVCGYDENYSKTLDRLSEQYALPNYFVKEFSRDDTLPQIAIGEDEEIYISIRTATENFELANDRVTDLTNKWSMLVIPSRRRIFTLHKVDDVCFARVRRAADMLQKQYNNQRSTAARSSPLSLAEGKGEVDAARPPRPGGGKESGVDDYDDSNKCTMPVLLNSIFSAVLLSFSQALSASETILDHFESCLLHESQSNSRSGRSPLVKRLYHLNRRVSVYQRVLSATETLILEGNTSVTEFFSELGYVEEDLSTQIAKAKVLHENCTNLLNLHLALLTNYTNELMTLLTLFSVFFIPLGFITGFFGMNFEGLPGLQLPYGYILCLASMAATVIMIFVYFKIKGVL